MAKADGDISHWAEYDYVIINDDIGRSLQQIESILAAERLKRVRQIGLSEFVRTLSHGE
jgi:guanylate kinase